MDKNSILKKMLLVFNRNMELFASVQSCFDSKLALLRRKRRKNLKILQSLRRKQILLLAILEENSTQRSLWKLSRESAFWEVNCNSNDDHFFKSHFRMSRASFDVLCSLLGKLKKKDTTWRSAISLEKRIAIALFTLSSSGEYRTVSELFGVGKSTVCTILIEFCEEVWQKMSAQYLKKLPPTQATVTECVDGFNRLGFPQCLGAIDGCHIEVRPNPNDATDYYNYNGWYSTVLLALVDYRYRFLYINIGAPGSCNVAEIYNSSLLKEVVIENEILAANKKDIDGIQMPICILGDSAFDFSTTLMKPYAFSTTLTDEQKLFNYNLSKCRRVVETAFVHLKARFHRIGKCIDNRTGNAAQIIRACCVLHNFLNDRNDSINQIWLENLQEFEISRGIPSQVVAIDDNEPNAEEIRQRLCCYFKTNDGAGDGEKVSSGEDGADGVLCKIEFEYMDVMESST